MNVKWVTVFLALCLQMALTPGYALAQQNQQDQPQELDKTRAAEQARREVNGRVLKVDRNQNKYRVKVLKKSGRVVSVDVDRRSGQVESNDDKGNKR